MTRREELETWIAFAYFWINQTDSEINPPNVSPPPVGEFISQLIYQDPPSIAPAGGTRYNVVFEPGNEFPTSLRRVST